MKSILLSLFVLVTLQQVTNALPNATYFCFKDGNQLDLRFILLDNGYGVKQVDALKTSYEVIADGHCQFTGNGQPGSPYSIALALDSSKDYSYDSFAKCGVDTSGAGNPNIYTFLFRARMLLGFNSANDIIYRLSCNPDRATNRWIQTFGVRANDVAETRLDASACITRLSAKKDNVETTVLQLGDKVKIIASVICGGRNIIAPQSIRITDLSVSNTVEFPTDVLRTASIVQSNGCSVKGTPFSPSAECLIVATPDAGVDFQYECGLIEIHTFTVGDQRTLFFKGKLHLCHLAGDWACQALDCTTTGRKKRAAPGDKDAEEKKLEVLIEPYTGAFGSSGQTKTGEEDCLESKLFIGVFVVIVVLLAMVTVLSIFLYTRIGKSRRPEIELSGKSNSAF